MKIIRIILAVVFFPFTFWIFLLAFSIFGLVFMLGIIATFESLLSLLMGDNEAKEEVKDNLTVLASPIIMTYKTYYSFAVGDYKFFRNI